MPYFLGGFRYDRGQEALEAARPDHRAYLRSLVERGHVIAAGPVVDGEVGRVVYRAADRAELDALVAADPYVVQQGATALPAEEWDVTVHDGHFG